MLSKSCFLLLRIAWRAMFLSLLAGCLFLILSYIFFWQIAQQRENLTQWLSVLLQQPVILQTLKPTWENGNPQIHLNNLQIGNHFLQNAVIELDLFDSLLAYKPIIRYINLRGLKIFIETATNAPPILDKEVIKLVQQIDPFISQTHLYLENAEFSNTHFQINIKHAEWLKQNSNYILTGQLERFFSDLYLQRTVSKGELNFEANFNPFSLEASLKFFLQQANVQVVNQTFKVAQLQSHWKAEWRDNLNVTGQIKIPSIDLAVLSAFKLPIESKGILNDINISLENHLLKLQCQGRDLSFFIKNEHDDPIHVSQLQAEILWNGHPHFEITLSNPDVDNLQIKGSLDEWEAELKNADISRVYYYIPKQAIGAKQWLSHGLSKGKITHAHAAWKNQHLIAAAHVEDGIINYSKGWQPITHANAEVTFKENTLYIQAQQGIIAKSKILPTTQIIIEHLTTKNPLLTVNGQLSGASADGLQFIHESPLKNVIDLQGLNLQGSMDLDLKLAIELNTGKADTEGTITLKDNKLSNDLLAKKNLSLTQVNGIIYFNNEGLNTEEEISAKLLDYPVTLEIERTTENGLQVDLNGNADRFFLEHLFQRLNPKIIPFLWYLSGQTEWNAQINYPPEELATLEITTDLKGAAISLPKPLGKSAEQTRLLHYQIPLEDEGEGHFQYANLFNGIFSYDFYKGTFHWGEQLSNLENAEGWKINGHFPELNLDQWWFLFEGITHSPSDDLPSISFDISTPSLKFANQNWKNFYLKGNLNNLAIKSDQINGNINYNNNLLKIDLNNLTVNNPPQNTQISHNVPDLENRETVYQQVRFDPRQLPMIQFKCRELKLNDLNLGNWRFQTTSSKEGLSIDRLQAHTEHVEIVANGTWNVSPHWTSLQMELISDDFGKGLNQLGYGSGAISGGKVKAIFQGNFPGDPLQFDRGYLEGTLDLNILDGRLEDIEPGAGRIFGLFDLYSAPRRLFLDFGDVLGVGLKFKTIGGHFKFTEGFAETKGLILDSTMSKVIFQGKTDLRRHLYDQTMLVLPNVMDTLSVASLGLGGVGVGIKAVTLLLESILKDELNQIVKFNYRITESWEKPRIEMINP
jgi:uncharacterized protein YhdP